MKNKIGNIGTKYLELGLSKLNELNYLRLGLSNLNKLTYLRF